MDIDSMIELIAEQVIWPGLTESHHGQKHWLRVFKLADKIMNCMALTYTGGMRMNKGVVGLAALMHDIGRVNDGRDASHGYRGVPIAVRIAGNIFSQGKNQIELATPQGFYRKMAELGMIADIVANHCLPGPGDYLEMQIVKDADKLDRVRLNGRKSIDVNRLALPDISVPLIDDAINLYEFSDAIVV